MSRAVLVAAWVLLGMLGALLELREYRRGRHPYADALERVARDAPVFLVFGLVLAAVGGPVYLAATIEVSMKGPTP